MISPNHYENKPEIGQFAPTSSDEVRGTIKYVSAKKTPGRDRITNRASKHVPLNATVYSHHNWDFKNSVLSETFENKQRLFNIHYSIFNIKEIKNKKNGKR